MAKPISDLLATEIGARDFDNLGNLSAVETLVFPPDKKLFQALQEAMRSTIGLKKNHKFVLPTELRDGLITPDHLRNWLNTKHGVNERDDIVLGPAAMKMGINFLFTNQEDADYDIIDGKRIFLGGECFECGRSTINSGLYESPEPYSCCDVIYPLQESWFNSFFSCCRECYLHPSLSLILEFMPQELIKIIQDYLQPIYTMVPVLSSGDGEQVVVVQNTSVVTEWLPIASKVTHEATYSASYGSAFVVFVNCNPESKFYRWCFTSRRGGWACWFGEKIHLQDLLK